MELDDARIREMDCPLTKKEAIVEVGQSNETIVKKRF
jgi:hypothetical protein